MLVAPSTELKARLAGVHRPGPPIAPDADDPIAENPKEAAQ